MHTSNQKLESATQRRGLLPASFSFFAIAIVFMIPILARQPKEVSAAVYSIWVSIMALVATSAFVKKGRRGAAIVAALVCALFVSLFVVYAYLAFVAPA